MAPTGEPPSGRVGWQRRPMPTEPNDRDARAAGSAGEPVEGWRRSTDWCCLPAGPLWRRAVAMNLARIHRLLQLIGLLQVGRGYNAESLALECGVSRRTIFRDLDVLRQSGIPLAFDQRAAALSHPRRRVCCRRPTSRRKRPCRWSCCATSWATARGLPFLGPARSAAVKLESSLPTRLREQLRDVVSTIRIQTPPINPLQGRKPIYEQLLDAIVHRRNVRIRYDSLQEQKKIVTRLSPYRMFFSRRSWYVVGRSSLHRAKRTFHLGRILRTSRRWTTISRFPAASRSSGISATPGT